MVTLPDGAGYLVMEFVKGSPLKGPFSVEKTVEYATQILNALDAPHRKGIIHRDLKPDYILLKDPCALGWRRISPAESWLQCGRSTSSVNVQYSWSNTPTDRGQHRSFEYGSSVCGSLQ